MDASRQIGMGTDIPASAYSDLFAAYWLQILAHHSDFPLEEDVADDALRAYTPFMRMLQFGLEALLLPSSSTDAPGTFLTSHSVSNKCQLVIAVPADHCLLSCPCVGEVILTHYGSSAEYSSLHCGVQQWAWH